MNQSDIKGYKVYLGPTAQELYFYADVTSTGATQETFSTEDLTAGHYYFAVSAYSSDGIEGPISATREKTIGTSSYNATAKTLLKGRFLKLEGGFKIPRLETEFGTPNMLWAPLNMDKLPGTTHWVVGHRAGYVVELTEPSEMGTGSSDTWPTLELGRSAAAFQAVDKIEPSATFWLDADTVLTSGRKSYRTGFTDNWIATIDLNTGLETPYTIRAPTDTESDNFHVLQALGAGFMRISDPDWANALANGNPFLLGVGGYDVLGSPLGPALGAWNIGDANTDFVLDFPLETPIRRDRFYTYPDRDPNTPTNLQLPIWQSPDAQDGFWQAGYVGGLAFINHPSVKGVLATALQARGLLDYRAQGDGGSGAVFLVEHPAVFYSTDSSGGNRANHESETLNATYPDGGYGRVGYVFDPDDLLRVRKGEINPSDVPYTRFEWPPSGLNYLNGNAPTRLLGVYWDNDRQLLWLAIAQPTPLLIAYSIVHDMTRPEERLQLSDEWKSFFDYKPAPGEPTNLSIQ
jgi:hypothetical protein